MKTKIRTLLALGRQRIAAAAFAALLAISTFGTVGTAHADNQVPPAQDKILSGDIICIIGTVINHDETLLRDGWEVTASPYGPDGKPTDQGAIMVTSDGNGQFNFADGLGVGLWQLSIKLKGEEGDWEPVTPAKFDVTFEYGKTKCIVVRFKLRRIVVVDVLKINDLHEPLSGWTIIATPERGNLFALQQTLPTDADGVASFRLSPGKWVFTERGPAGVIWEPVIPLGALTVDIQPPGPISLRFKNRIKPYGCIEVVKQDQPPNTTESTGLPGWGVAVHRLDGTVAAKGVTDAFGYIKFSKLPLGPYLVVEETRLGWKPVSPTRVHVNLVDGEECASVQFTNEQDPAGYVIVGYKLDTNKLVGLPNWKITASPLEAGDYAPMPAFTDGTGRFEIVFPDNDYRVPGSKYKVCEEEKVGWQPHTPLCQVVTLPVKPSAPVHAKIFENQQVGHWENGHNTCSKTHVIIKGDTWRSVARMYKISIRTLMRENRLIRSRNRLTPFVGRVLCIP